MSIFIFTNQNIPPSIFYQISNIFTPIQDKQTKTNKKVGNYNSLLTHLRHAKDEIMDLEYLCQTIYSWVENLGYGYEWVLHLKSKGYGSETRSVDTGTNFRIQINFAKLSPLGLQL